MSLESPRLRAQDMRDEPGQLPAIGVRQLATGAVFGFARARVDLGGEIVTREYVTHPGAVAILALRPGPDGDEALVIKQYRHPLGIREWELPAGLLDVPGEPPWEAAARELAEEAGLTAGQWHVLGGYAPSPGMATEIVRLYLARDLSDVPSSRRAELSGEERGIETGWAGLDGLHDAVLAGRFSNTPLNLGVLAAVASRDRGWSTLRPYDSPWPEHPAYRE